VNESQKFALEKSGFGWINIQICKRDLYVLNKMKGLMEMMDKEHYLHIHEKNLYVFIISWGMEQLNV